MVTKYVWSQLAGGQAIFEWKYMFFQLVSTIKVFSLWLKWGISAYLSFILPVKHKKITSYLSF